LRNDPGKSKDIGDTAETMQGAAAAWLRKSFAVELTAEKG
jgi:hypothetical protein